MFEPPLESSLSPLKYGTVLETYGTGGQNTEQIREKRNKWPVCFNVEFMLISELKEFLSYLFWLSIWWFKVIF